VLLYTLSTPLNSEAVNLSIDHAPHESSTGTSENIHSTLTCAGRGPVGQLPGDRDKKGKQQVRVVLTHRLSLCRGC